MVAEFMTRFVAHADRVMHGLTMIYPWVAETVQALRVTGRRLGIVSSKYRYRIERILAEGGLAPHFEVIVGGEDVSRHKPDPAGLLGALALRLFLVRHRLVLGKRVAGRPRDALAPAVLRDPHADAHATPRLGVVQHDVREVDRRLLLEDAALLGLPAGARVALDEVDLLHDHPPPACRKPCRSAPGQ